MKMTCEDGSRSNRLRFNAITVLVSAPDKGTLISSGTIVFARSRGRRFIESQIHILFDGRDGLGNTNNCRHQPYMHSRKRYGVWNILVTSSACVLS